MALRPDEYANLKGKLVARMQCDLTTGCWEWMRNRHPTGYGMMHFLGRKQYAHRLMWEVWHGEIPAGMEIDHLCRNRCCINPKHLELVTHQENARRGDAGIATGEMQSSKTHCGNGHEFTEENTYMNPGGYRACRECQRAGSRKHYWKNKEAHDGASTG